MMTPNDHSHDDNFTERVLERIESEHVTPRPRWEFLFKNYFFWTLGALAVVLGALAFSAVLFELTAVDWRLSPATHESFFSFFLAAAPFLWVGALALFVLIGYANVRRTNHGYRYSLAVIALGAVLTSLSLGSGLYALGFGIKIDEALGDHPPFYRPIIAQEHSWWLAPERGLLIGEVLGGAPVAASFLLRDSLGRTWKVNGSDLRTPDLAALANGGAIRVVGAPVPTPIAPPFAFHACFVFPWQTHGSAFDEPTAPLATATPFAAESATTTRSSACKNIRSYEPLHRAVNTEGH